MESKYSDEEKSGSEYDEFKDNHSSGGDSEEEEAAVEREFKQLMSAPLQGEIAVSENPQAKKIAEGYESARRQASYDAGFDGNFSLGPPYLTLPPFFFYLSFFACSLFFPLLLLRTTFFLPLLPLLLLKTNVTNKVQNVSERDGGDQRARNGGIQKKWHRTMPETQ